MSFSITKLKLAKCEDRTVLASNINNPEALIKPSLGKEYYSYNFNFFVDWNRTPYEIKPVFWITRLLRYKVDFSKISNSDILNAFNENGGQEYLKNLNEVLGSYGKIECVLLGEREGYKVNSMSPYWKIDIDNNIETNNVNHLSKLIFKSRGGEAPMGSKGLIYGTSDIECYLSKTGNNYPGDCDSLISKDGKVAAIIEFKKHTLDDDISNHLAGKYYSQGKDIRKYEALFALGRMFNNSPPVIILYFSTKQRVFRLQCVDASEGNWLVKSDSSNIFFKDKRHYKSLLHEHLSTTFLNIGSTYGI